MISIPAQFHREVRHVRDSLKREFESLIYIDDVRGPEEKREEHFLSRALAALVVRKLLDCSSEEAADCVVDGFQDEGIDAVAISDSGTRMWLVQSKWSDKGTASLGKSEALKFGYGLDLLDGGRFTDFNHRVQSRSGLIEDAWRTIDQLTLVVVTMGSASLTQEAIKYFEYLQRERYNRVYEFLNYESWNIRQIHGAVRDDIADPPITLVANFDEWLHLADPFESYQGRMPAVEVAEWFGEHGARLFTKNIRENLGVTRVNQGLEDTLKNSPENFWYFNNGITVLCDSAEYRAVRKGAYSPITLTMAGASIINGAQTVASIHSAMQNAPTEVNEAFVSVKVITTRSTPDNFGVSVTRAANTQNQVVPQDFAALDKVQWQIREDFRISLGKQYTIRRGEIEPAPDTGVSLASAALALACAHSNIEFAVRAKISLDTLWEAGTRGTYTILFGQEAPSAIQIWRSVQVLRAVRSWLASTQDERLGRARSIAASGELLLLHLVFRALDLEVIDGTDDEWDAEFERVPELAAKALSWLIYRVDAHFGPTSVIKTTFEDVERAGELVALVLADLPGQDDPPPLPAGYTSSAPARRRRRPNTVPTLVNSGRIAEGTVVHFRTNTSAEREAIGEWLDKDPSRSRATWVNQRGKPLLWEHDRQQYSPTGLVNRIWELAGWKDQYSPVAGPTRWEIPGEGLLWEIAWKIQDEEASAEDKA